MTNEERELLLQMSKMMLNVYEGGSPDGKAAREVAGDLATAIENVEKEAQ